MFFAAPKEGLAAFSKVLGFEGLEERVEEELGPEIAERFRQCSISHWQQAFSNSSSAAVPLMSLLATRDDSLQVESAGEIDIDRDTFRVIRHDTHPMGRWCDLVAPNAVRPLHAKINIPGPMPKYGEHTREILESVGFTEEQITGMISREEAGESWSEKYLPE